MKLTATKIKDLYIIEHQSHIDDRGSFQRVFCQTALQDQGLSFPVTQINLSTNRHKDTLRGLHFQKEPHGEDKIVQCLKGSIYDVVVDLRKGSDTFGQWLSIELTDSNKRSLLIPKGCAHGFQTLADDCQVLYLMSHYYSPDHASGVRWNDPFFNIDWPVAKRRIISDKDQNWPLIKNN
jgi:dTDP-4-dehydrorhamnose 3,5-epimerase